MYSAALEYVQTNVDKKKQYGQTILTLSRSQGRLVAFHGFCTDGIVSASLLHFFKEADVFIPLDYWSLSIPPLRSYFQTVDWYAILDLEPFNSKLVNLYVDHHISSINRSVLARRVHFETGPTGPSAASVLATVFSSDTLPVHLQELIEISKITDTATFSIDPPLIAVSHRLPENFADRVWFLEDACKSADTVSQMLELVELLSEGGLSKIFVPKICQKINYYRRKRLYATNYARSLDPEEVTVIINPPDGSTLEAIIAVLLRHPKVKVTASLIETASGVKISLRRSNLYAKTNPRQAEQIRLDLLAKSMNGGGHAAAAGARTPTLTEGLAKIRQWAHTFHFKLTEVNVRAELRSYRA